MKSPAAAPPRGLAAAERALFVVLGAWLVAAAALIDVEYYDGFEAVANAAFFAGKTGHYVANRMPLISLVLAPAEWVKSALSLHPLEVRPHHAVMALLTFGYLLWTRRLINARFGRTWASFLAFAAAVPSFIFFSYAPFVSHDIIPGVLFLAMLTGAERFLEKPEAGTWLALTALAAAAALVKQTCALFWVLTLLSFFLAQLTGKKRGSFRPLLPLAAGALASGAVVWLALGLVLGNPFPDSPLLARPLLQIRGVGNIHAADRALLFPWWIYARNFWAYGIAASALVIPGLVMALKGSRLRRAAAFSWIFSVALIQSLSFREVRYLAFLAPLTAFLIAPPIAWVLRRRAALAVLSVLLLADVTIAASAARLVAHPFFRESPEKEFLAPLAPKGRDRLVLMDFEQLSFFPKDLESPLAGDPYHLMFHLGWHHVMLLYGYRTDQFAKISFPSQWRPELLAGGDLVLIQANGITVNGAASEEPPYVPKERLDLSLYRGDEHGFNLLRRYTENGVERLEIKVRL